MNIDRQIAEEINQLTPEDLQYVCKLVCLMRFCPGFSEELKRIIPNECGAASPEQLAATNDLMNKWLLEEGWAELLRPELESMGVMV